jgi:hypothetical protein
MSVFEKLTEGIVNRDLKKEGAALLSKWEKTGLLEGLDNDTKKNGMARLLENQAKELLREAASSMAAGDVQGFAAVAFPIVRRVFGGLIANDLVSVQPMSLPSGLIFFLDFTFGDTRLDNVAGTSLYGGGRVASQITGGVTLTGANAEAGFYALNNGYASPTGSFTSLSFETQASGTIQDNGVPLFSSGGNTDYEIPRILRFDPDLVSGSAFVVATVGKGALKNAAGNSLNFDDLVALEVAPVDGNFDTGELPEGRLVRRLTREDPNDENNVLLVVEGTGSMTAANCRVAIQTTTIAQGPVVDQFNAADAVGSVVGAVEWGLENEVAIPEINIKVDSIAVTAVTKKLKAKWTPELGQDLNAYHNLDAEVELTSILSEQIALEIDREILEDLIKGAEGGTLYWSRSPGMFLNKETGAEVGAASAAPDFTGTVAEWYETLLETINDVSARIHRKTLRGGANFIVCSPEVASILEFTAGFRAAVTVDGDRGTAGAVKTGQLSKKLDVYVDPYFPRNVILVGRRGGSFLESGYVYAPYVPLQVTPTIFGIEDFVPRKGVMTRYAKKMVRPDMYGLVICRGLIGEAGATA